MNNCFEYYTLKLKTLSPTFVGSGKNVGKKEFCFDEESGIIRFIDMEKFMEYLVAQDSIDNKNRIEKFEAFMINSTNSNLHLNKFMDNIEVPIAKREEMTIYKVNNNGCFDDDHPLSAISCFMRNKENKAYIPGSSVKGMLRTVLLQYLIRQNKYQPDIFETNKNGNPKKNNVIIREQAAKTEKELINSLTLKKKYGVPNSDDAVNSIMKGLIISDSEFIDDSNFIVCQKYDVFTDGIGINKINKARECLMRGAEVEFKIKIDRRYFKPKNVSGSFEQLFKEMIAAFDSEYKDFYLDKFMIPNGNKDDFGKQFVILGGGSGFFGKTLTYTLNGFDDGLRKTADALSKNKINNKLVNPNDYEVGISPHMLKETEIGGTYYHMGLCSVSIERDRI